MNRVLGAQNIVIQLEKSFINAEIIMQNAEMFKNFSKNRTIL
jgi:hypothetical protein